MDSLRELAARYGGLAWRRRWWGILAAWIICLGGWVIVSTMPNQYEANARVYIDADAVLTPLLKGIAVESSLQDQLDLLTHMLLSRPNLERIIQKTDLQLETVTSTDTERMVEKLAERIQVVAQTRNIFSITYRNTNRQLAADVVQAMLASFIENKAGDNRDEIDRASTFIDGQIASYEAQLRDAEAKRAEFRKKYLDLLPGDNGTNRLEQARQAVTTLTGDLQDAKAERALIAKELASTQSTFSSEGYAAPNNPQTELRAAEARLRELKQMYTDAYPEVVTQQRLVDDLRRNPDQAPATASGGASPGSVRSAANPVYEQFRLRLTETDGKIESLTRQIADATAERDRLEAIAKGVPELEAQYINLNRDYDIVRKNYDELVSRREGMRISDAAEKKASNIKLVIIDPPTAPRVPVAPNRVLLSIGVLLAGLGAGAGVIAAMLALDQSFHSVAELRALGMTVIGSVSLAVLPMTNLQKVRQVSLFGAASAALFMVFGGVLAHFARMT
jgi:polysaccharide chain length determinant protein (PEP-CTERM system associated)